MSNPIPDDGCISLPSTRPGRPVVVLILVLVLFPFAAQVAGFSTVQAVGMLATLVAAIRYAAPAPRVLNRTRI